MRIDTQLTESERDAIKEYAVNHGYTMKRAYTSLIKSALHDRFLMRLHPETGNIGVKFASADESIMTNVGQERFFSRLRHYDGDWTRIYSPRWYALERAGIDPELEPTFWIDGEEKTPETKE